MQRTLAERKEEENTTKRHPTEAKQAAPPPHPLSPSVCGHPWRPLEDVRMRNVALGDWSCRQNCPAEGSSLRDLAQQIRILCKGVPLGKGAQGKE